MSRIRLTVRYDGTEFAGSQIQPGERTVAGTLTAGLETILGQSVHLVFAGRTDAGVHADGNVCAFDAEPAFPVERLPQILAARLPDDLFVADAMEAAADFHPRFAARRRTYIYRVHRGDTVPVDRMRYCTHYTGPYPRQAVRQALDAFAGAHSFHNFCHGSEEPRHCRCELEPVEVREAGPEVEWVFSGDRFLRHMICRMAGAVLLVAQGKVTPGQVVDAIDNELDFQLKPAPAKGLTLHKVEY